MSVAAIGNYDFPAKDRVENFHGNQVVYVCWDDHLMFSAPLTFPLPPAMPFGDLVNGLLPTFYGMHPDFKQIDWDGVNWSLDQVAFKPDLSKSLTENGVGHKSVIRFQTPGLNGYKGSSS